MMDEQLRTLYQDVARNEVAIEALKDRMDAGDRNVRQGVENLKEVFTQLQVDVKTIAAEMLGPEGKQNIRNAIEGLRAELQEVHEEMLSNRHEMSRELKALHEDLNDLKKEFSAHTSDHRETEGAEGALKMLKRNWVYPVATGFIIVLVTVILNVLVAYFFTPVGG